MRASLQTILYCREREKMENIFKNPRLNFTWSNRGQVTLYQYHNSLFFELILISRKSIGFCYAIKETLFGIQYPF